MSLIGENFPPPTGGMVVTSRPNSIAMHEAAVTVDLAADTQGVVGPRGTFVSNYTLNRVATAAWDYSGVKALSPTAMVVQGGINSLSNTLAFIGDEVVGYTDITAAGVSVISTTDVGKRYWYAELCGNGIHIITGVPLDPSSTVTPISFMWAGSIKSWNHLSVASRTATGTVTLSGAVVTGVGTDFTTKFSVGDFFFYNSRYAGIIKTITNDTSLTLVDTAYCGTKAAAGTGAGNSLVYVFPRYASGVITTRTTQSVAIGANTNFQAFPTAAGDQVTVFARNIDSRTSGTPSTFLGFAHYDASTDNPLNFSFRQDGVVTTTNALANSDNAYWFAYRSNATYMSNMYTKLHTVYAGRSWYVGTYQENTTEVPLYYSTLDNFQDVDTSNTGSWFNVQATQTDPILRIVGTRNCLVIFNRKTVWAVYGNSPSNFRYERISLESAIGPGAITLYRDGVAWVGDNGIYFFNGSVVDNYTAKSFGSSFRSYHMAGMARRINGTLVDATHYTNATLTTVSDNLLFSFNDAFKLRGGISYPAPDTAYKDAFNNCNPWVVYAPGIVVNPETKVAGLWSNCAVMGKTHVNNKAHILSIGLVSATSSTSSLTSPALYLTEDIYLINNNTGGGSDSFVAYTPDGPTGTLLTLLTSGTLSNARGLIYGSAGSDYCLEAGTPSYGALRPAFHSTRLTSFSGGAFVGNRISSSGLFWSGYFTPSGGNMDIKVDIADLPSPETAYYIMQFCYKANNKTTEILSIRISATTGYRISFSAGSLLIEEVTFTSSSSWTVGSNTNRYTNASPGSPAYIQFAVRLPAFFNPSINLINANAGDQLAWTITEERIGGLSPYLMTRAFSNPGVSTWLRKLRAFYRTTNNVTPVHLVTNMDDVFAVESTWLPTSLPSTVGDSETFDIRMGRIVETWQYVIAPRSRNSTWNWFGFTNFFKTRRSGRY